MKWNYKLLGKQAAPGNQHVCGPGVQHGTNGTSPIVQQQAGGYQQGQKLIRHEIFIQPTYSLYDFFMRKPTICSLVEYDSSQESDSNDDSDEEYLKLYNDTKDRTNSFAIDISKELNQGN